MIHGSEFSTNIKDVVAFPVIPEVRCDETWMEKVSEPPKEVHEFGDLPGSLHFPWEGVYDRGKTTGGLFSKPTGLTGNTDWKGSKKQKKKDRWKQRASTNHCYTCEHYTGDGQCKIVHRTTPMSSCAQYCAMLDVPDLWEEEAIDWLRLSDPEASEKIKKGIANGVTEQPRSIVAP
jgi:hypothetical protein